MTYARVMFEAHHCPNIYYFLFYVLYRNEVGVNVAEIKIWCIVIDVLQLVLWNSYNFRSFFSALKEEEL